MKGIRKPLLYQLLLKWRHQRLIPKSDWRLHRKLMKAIKRGDSETLALNRIANLLAAGALLDHNPNFLGFKTALMKAVRQDSFRIVEHLIRYGANVNARTANGRTPLMIAKKFSSSSILKLLSDHGARGDARIPAM